MAVFLRRIFFFESSLRNVFCHSKSAAYCIFDQFLNAEKIVDVLQPSAAAQRYAGSTHTVSGNCWHALGMHPHPRSRVSASGQFLVCYHTLLIRTQIL
jgi:hypothetical protein